MQIQAARNVPVLVETVKVAYFDSLADSQDDDQPDIAAVRHNLLAELVELKVCWRGV